ncbi:hypothetical protein [Nostoc sp. NMS8]|nr:hypothetical protein [Nostoc sp. NMS8]MBN3958721.1 hypothetical protein [Nostoc sp. NMS8]
MIPIWVQQRSDKQLLLPNEVNKEDSDMQLTTHAISKLALSALTTGCVLILSGYTNNTATARTTPTPITPTSVVSGNTKGQPTIQANRPSTPQPTNIPDGTIKLRYSSGGVVHEGRLIINGDSGKLFTRFFDIKRNKTATVEQTIEIENTAKGLVLWGYYPVYPGTKTPYPDYSADNFVLRINVDGSYFLRTCDDAENCSDVEVIDN